MPAQPDLQLICPPLGEQEASLQDARRVLVQPRQLAPTVLRAVKVVEQLLSPLDLKGAGRSCPTYISPSLPVSRVVTHKQRLMKVKLRFPRHIDT